MGSTGAGVLFYCVALSMVAVGSATAAGGDIPHRFISEDVLKSADNITDTSHRKLIGFPEVCPVKFENNRQIDVVVNSCRGTPTAERCCGALKKFACPYTALINNNERNGCASDMFFEIMVRGRLRPGIFSTLCHEGPIGLDCVH
ncbi:hypothetical protein ACP70R_009914 [Stipagrostis hirtigluma subsp. patula]